MIKKRLMLILILSTFLTLTSCGLDYRYFLDESLHDQIEFVWEEDGSSHIVYCGDTYVFVGTTNFFRVNAYQADVNHYKSYEDDILLSWNGYRYVWYIDEYYSYTTDSPLFIYNERLHWVYFHEDYNYLTDIFVVGDTTAEIVWEDIFGSQQPGFDFVDPVKVLIYSKQCPRIKTYLKLVCIENQWYLSLPDSKTVWTPSDEFIKILSENGII